MEAHLFTIINKIVSIIYFLNGIQISVLKYRNNNLIYFNRDLLIYIIGCQRIPLAIVKHISGIKIANILQEH